MCGIAGMYLFKRASLQHHYFKWCLQTMRHRGPDAQDMWSNDNYITAFARLAIRDLSSNGNQPMLSDCVNYCITFNGEIYNTEALRKALSKYRSHYHSTSDTEVLLYALIHLGVEKTLQLADGIFAFAFYNIRENKLFVARDRIGIKPLYVAECSEGFVYSSQYDHIINHTFFKNEAWNEKAIATYLSLGYMPANSGVIAKTRMLPHGYYLCIENATVTQTQYYSYATKYTYSSVSLESVLEESVKSQMVSDVPVGTFMSGGVDSTLVSYYANKYTNLNSFTIGLKDSNLDESFAAQEFANIFKTNHLCKYLTQNDLLTLLDDNAAAFTEPFADPSSLPTLLLSGFAKEKVTVALSGDGGDELFWGYPRNKKALDKISFYKKNRFSKKMSLLINKFKSPASTDVSRHWKMQSFIDYYYSSFFITGALNWLPKLYIANPLEAYFLNDCKNEYSSKHDEDAHMNIARKLEMDIHLQRILLKVDRASMHHSLEVRVPLLSNNMLTQSLSYTHKQCIEGYNGKMVLKNLLLSKANESLVMQRKKGFDIPVDDWIRTSLKKDITEKLLDMPQSIAIGFHKKILASMLAAHMGGKQNNGWLIWAVYSLVVWHNKHVNKFAH